MRTNKQKQISYSLLGVLLALIHSDFRGAHCCDEGIIIEIEQ